MTDDLDDGLEAALAEPEPPACADCRKLGYGPRCHALCPCKCHQEDAAQARCAAGNHCMATSGGKIECVNCGVLG